MKFSSTMKISDLYQTQMMDNLGSQIGQTSGVGRKSKNSLKSTQNINLMGDEQSILRKNSIALNNQQHPQVTMAKGLNQRKSQIMQNSEMAAGKCRSNNRRQESIDKTLTNNLLNFYQDEDCNIFLEDGNIKLSQKVIFQTVTIIDNE